MITFITVIHITAIVLLVISVLLQSGKGAEISANFGGSSQTVFGSSGGANFFQKLTYGLAAVFMVTSLTLTILPSRLKKSVFEGYTPPAPSAPATTTVPPVAPANGSAPITSAAATTTAPANTAPTAAATNTATTTAPAANPAAPASAPAQKK